MNRSVPSSFSSPSSDADRLDWTMYNRAAARGNEPSSTTARKYSSCLSSTTDRLRPPSRNVDHPGGCPTRPRLKIGRAADGPARRRLPDWDLHRPGGSGARAGRSPCRRSLMPDNAVAGLDVAEIATSSLALPRRAEQMLTALRRLVPFDGAWLALADPQHPRYATAAAADLADSTLALFTSPQQARDIEATGTDRARPPLSPSDLPFPVEELPGWAECLIPAGYREGLAVALFGPGGRHVGFLATLSGDSGTPAPEIRRALARLAPVLARGVDPAFSLSATARIVRDAHAGVVVSADGSAEPLPGMDGHPVLAAGSPALAAACAHLAAGRVHRSFLWPVGGRH